jgi:hypothetical protein
VKVETRLFLYLGLFFIPVLIFYGIMTRMKEPLGLVALLLTSLMCLMIGAYLVYTARHIDPRPEDDRFGRIDEAGGELGFFPPFSWWPLPLAMGCALLFAGLAVGWWLFFVGVPITALAVVGWVFEYYRGAHAH